MAAADPTPFGLTIADALRAAADRGFTAQFDAAAGGEVVQPADDRAFPAGQVSPRYLWRIDGASDVADQLLVVAVEAPDGARGTVVLTYGPNATEVDSAVLDQLSLDGAEPGPAPDAGATPTG